MVDKYDNYELRKVTSLENKPGTIKDGDGYIWDPSGLPDKDFDDSKVPLEYRRLAMWMRSKLFGKDVRETIARLAEMIGLNSKELMGYFQETNSNQRALKDHFNQSLEDIRIGYDGTVYDSPGEAVRQQIVASMGVIIDNRIHRTHGTAVNISYDINQLDLSGAKIQVKFDSKIVGGVGSKFRIRHSDGNYKSIGEDAEYWSPVMESSSKGTSHIFTVDISDELIEKSKFLTVTTNGASGTTKVDLEITNIEIRTVGLRINAGGVDVEEVGGGVVVISSEQTKPTIAKEDEALLEYDTGKVFFYNGTEWIEWGGFV